MHNTLHSPYVTCSLPERHSRPANRWSHGQRSHEAYAGFEHATKTPSAAPHTAIHAAHERLARDPDGGCTFRSPGALPVHPAMLPCFKVTKGSSPTWWPALPPATSHGVEILSLATFSRVGVVTPRWRFDPMVRRP